MMLLLVGCGVSGWTRDAAWEPTLARLDADHDGKVVEAEYARASYAAPPFTDVDRDHDGSLSLGELETMVFLQDPNTFDGSLARTAPDLSLGPGVSGTMTPRQRLLWELYTVLEEEAHAANPDVLVPPAWEILAAANTGRLDSPESREMIVQLSRAWGIAAGLTFPPSLVQYAPGAGAPGGPGMQPGGPGMGGPGGPGMGPGGPDMGPGGPGGPGMGGPGMGGPGMQP